MRLDKAKLASACRQNDANSEGNDNVLEHLDVDVEDAMCVAEQRALRVILFMRGKDPRVCSVPGGGLYLLPKEKEVLTFLKACWLDGLVAALRALEEGEKGAAC